MDEYNKKAIDFLSKTKTSILIYKAINQKSPLWTKKEGDHGIHYIVTLKNNKANYTFDFWNSIRNKEIIESIEKIKGFGYDSERIRAEKLLEYYGVNYKGIIYKKEAREALIKQYEPKEYDILACLSPLYEDTLEDFCSAFGYDEDSITALKTFEACKEQDRMLRKLFNESELELLSNIQ